MQRQNIRIRLKAFDHRILDNSTKEIVNTATVSYTHLTLPTNREV